jgi:mono/diheme cytochrome c family protein
VEAKVDVKSRTQPDMISWKTLVSGTGMLAFLAIPTNAQEMGHSGAGLAAARQLCSQCHAVERGERSAPAPAFQDIARTPGMNAMALSAALHTSHEVMPNIMLTPEDKADIMAYILSLK